MTKKFKISLIAFLSLIIVAIVGTFFVPFNSSVAYAEEQTTATTTASGTCGTNLTWELDSTGELHIKGSGAMEFYSIGSAPWYAYRNSIKSIVVDNAVTSIGAGVFSGMSSLEELTIPFVGRDKYIYKGTGGYSSYSNETNKHYPLGYMFGTTSYSGGIEAYQYYSYDYFYTSNSKFTSELSSYTSYYIPSTLKTVNVTNSEYIFSGAFSFAYSSSTAKPLNITTITLNEGIKNIGEKAFASDNLNSSTNVQVSSKLENINLPTTLTSIEEYAFYNCQKLDTVEISGSVKTIENYAFYNCKDLYTQIGSGVQTIGNYAFYGCSSLGNQTYPSTLTTIGSYAFSGCTAFTEINIPSNVKAINNGAFSGCSNVKSITLEEGIETIGSNVFANIKLVTKLVIPTTVTSIGAGVFSGMSSLEELTIPFVGRDKYIYKGTGGYKKSCKPLYA